MKHRIHNGIFIVTSLETGKETFHKSFTCCHCGTVGKLHQDQDKTQDGGMCYRCAKLLCRRPACHNNCMPYTRKIGVDI